MTEADVLDRMIQQSQSTVEQLRAALQLEERYLADLCKRRQALIRAGESRSRPAPHPASNGPARPSRAARVHADSIPSHVVAILEHAGHEMKLTDVARELEKRGLTTTSKGGMKALAYSSIMSRRDLFERVGPEVYDLKSRHPESGRVTNGR